MATQIGHIFARLTRAGAASERPYEEKCNGIGNFKFEMALLICSAALEFFPVGARLAAPARVTPAKNVAYFPRRNAIRHSSPSSALVIAHDVN